LRAVQRIAQSFR